MERDIKIGILDQSVVRTNATPRAAVQETIDTAIFAEDLGFHRFWISEHHNSKFIAGSTPEVLLARLGAETSNIRLGSGGIMLPNHSAFKVAENFRMLEALYPGRIDLGMGRAPGGDQTSANLLNPSNTFQEEDYINQIQHINQFFKDDARVNSGAIYAVPQVETTPQQWILSSSGGSAKIAADLGLNLAVAKFINGSISPSVVETYRKNFIATEDKPEPKALVSSFVMCGETEEEANQMRKYIDYILLQFDKGNYQELPAFEDIRNHNFTSFEKQRLHYNAGRLISGTPDRVREKISALAKDFDVDEVIISTISFDRDLRFRSFELVAEAFNMINVEV
ncbi:LLM class flavin-dependent oxidoreductase [Zunongwangia endophytica]|uniref:LLM class flavin-dependent oxidoreductase n=1 Tax=Zunongwangia endophytica TaxID=1808945 RepID=A0ABV8H739_9FLAO|nr:LLM class flavin-dependent oxidoreductase [Zunongwangia endophytica]MDN3595773.1 LLM class flavin-dependent oxidoreductase [Zunongwangia endophytica]